MPYLNEEWIKQQQADLDVLRQQASSNNTQQDAVALQIQQDTSNLIKEQLSLSTELTNIENLLKGKVLDAQTEQWVSPPDVEMIILTDHGVHLIMNTIQFYLNKNTLLSNYDEKTINNKMEDFSTDLADTIFMEYEKVFRYPTFEECKKKLNERIERKVELREYAFKLLGKEINKEKIREKFIKEIEGSIEKEIEKIKEQVIKNKLKRFALIIREVQDAVHSTYLRAWNGQERRTLRQHIHISESSGYSPPQQKGGSRVNPSNWFRR